MKKCISSRLPDLEVHEHGEVFQPDTRRRGCGKVVRPALAEKSLDIRVTGDTQTLAILGDGRRLQQIVWTLLNNAVKFTPSGGHPHDGILFPA
jgi:signal transduction histidine kinase